VWAEKNDASSVRDSHCQGKKNGRLEGGGGRAPQGVEVKGWKTRKPIVETLGIIRS